MSKGSGRRLLSATHRMSAPSWQACDAAFLYGMAARSRTYPGQLDALWADHPPHPTPSSSGAVEGLPPGCLTPSAKKL